MQLQKAQRIKAKIKMALQGPSGSGKTFSSLEVAYGLCGDWSKVAVVCSENGSANLYAHMGEYNIMELCLPHSPERYIQAIETCEKAGMEVIILDSVTHEWEYLLDYHASLQGNSFTNWSKVTPRHNAFVQKILSSSCHIICTVRTKTDYVMNEKNGKLVPEKVGLKSVQRDGLDYEMTLVFDLDIKNNALASKDRTGLFYGKPEQKLSVETGKQIADWCNSGSIVSAEDVNTKIGSCKSIQELLTVYRMYPQYQEVLKKGYEQKKRELILLAPDNRSEIVQLPTSSNGVLK
jgi:hypothetical protein